MDEEQAREILGDSIAEDGSFVTEGGELFRIGDDRIFLEGHYSANELEAIAWWMQYGSGA